MFQLTIRNLDLDLKAALRVQAAQAGVSMEQQVRNILRRALKPTPAPGLAERIAQRFAGLQAQDLPIPARRTTRLPDLSDLQGPPNTVDKVTHPSSPSTA